MAKKPRLILPAGIAVFPKLNEVDVYQPVNKKGQPNGAVKRQYITYVRYEPEVLKDVMAMIKKAAKELGADEDAKLPFKKQKVSKDSEEKELVLKAASGEKFRPGLFDAKNNAIPVSRVIGGGSLIKLDVTPAYYEGFGGGINLYLNAVQVLDLVENTRGQSQFEEADGYEDDGEASGSNFDATDGDSNDLDDEIPF